MPTLSGYESLPPVRIIHARGLIRAENERLGLHLVVLDDDPTGCQTVYNVPVLLSWDQSTLSKAVRENACLYVLHNSRSVTATEAEDLNHEIMDRLRPLLPDTQWRIVSRSDSTLRGHFRAEVEALEQTAGPFDGLLLAPYFGEGGRLTIDDTHYVAEDDRLIPAHETEFARDPVFGFSTPDDGIFA